LRAAFLNLIEEHSDQLSEKFHDPDKARLYSIDPFPFDSRFRTYFTEGKEYTFGVHFFGSKQLEDQIRTIILTHKDPLRFHAHLYPILQVDYKQHNLSELMGEWSSSFEVDSKGEIQLSMRFLTPTQLSQFGSDKAYLLPTPEKIFPSLLRLWNKAGVETRVEQVSEYHDWVTQNIYVSRHRIQTVVVSLGGQRHIVGFVGGIEYSIQNADTQLARLTVGLAKFSEICNVGKNRTAGFGKVSLKIN
jgi:CRISPR-associated endoribonuclease Cas6